MSDKSDMALLRRFEPVIRFTRGEKFFPMDVERYVQACSLWVQRPRQEARCLLPSEKLMLDELGGPFPDEFGTVHFLKLTEPLSAAELAVYTLQKSRKERHSKDQFYVGRGRLARVGYTSRLVDALFSVTLLARGRVPGDTAAAATLTYERLQAKKASYRYHGRVVRQNGWTVLQYWYFYMFNNWRSGFFGANDHEADWEMVCIFLSESEDGDWHPEWVTYASHDYSGDDLRRRWDDPEVEWVGEHPVIYAGAGSHAGYYTRGEYLTELELPFLAPVMAVTDQIQKFWHNTLQQYKVESPDTAHEEASEIFRIPFVDYARGDGLSIGVGGDVEWDTPCFLDDLPAWVVNYRGLWGLYTRDPFAFENAPAGPMYNRDGSVRQTWYDPVGWAGLDKVPPANQALEMVLVRQKKIERRHAEQRASIKEKSQQLKGLGIEAAAMRGQPHLSDMYEAQQAQIKALSQEVDQLRAQLAADEALLASLKQYRAQLQAGHLGDPRSHIQRSLQPATEANLRAGHIAEAWAAASIGLTLMGIVGLAYFAPDYLTFGIITLLALFWIIEATFRGQLISLVTNTTIALAVIAALILFYEFFRPIITLTVFFAGAYLLWENLRELWT
ncbi:MAG: PspA/IM30 family protein [Ardenticatenaceae bacterium]